MTQRYEWGVANRDPLSGHLSNVSTDPEWNEADARLIADVSPFSQIVRRPVGKWEAIE